MLTGIKRFGSLSGPLVELSAIRPLKVFPLPRRIIWFSYLLRNVIDDLERVGRCIMRARVIETMTGGCVDGGDRETKALRRRSG